MEDLFDAQSGCAGEGLLLGQCLEFFLSDATLKSLLEGFVDKYISLGHVGGTVVLKGLELEQIEVLEGLFSRNYHGRKSISISADKVQGALDKSRYQGIFLEKLLQEYCAGELKGRKAQRLEREKRERDFFRRISKEYENTCAGDWMQELLLTHEPPYMTFRQRYREDEGAAEIFITTMLHAVNELPIIKDEYCYLPIFATMVTGDPHYFDRGGENLNVLFCAITFYTAKHVPSFQVSKGVFLSRAEQSQELLLAAGILRDDISNNTICYGIRAFSRSHREHGGIEGFFLSGEPVLLSLRAVLDLEKIICGGGRIYVVENPSIFSKLTEKGRMEENKAAEISFMCTSGQPKLASLLLLDKIAESGNQIFYGGDFDPEGLLIADRFKSRYGEKLQFWNMHKENYLNALSGKELTDRRLGMLDRLEDPSLREIAEEMRKEGKAGYQEKILGQYVRLSNSF